MKLIPILLFLFAFQTYSIANHSDTLLIKKHLKAITNTEKPRNYRNLATLNKVADYIYSEFEQYADTTYFQTYEAYNKTYKNVVAVLGNDNAKTIVIGAHYDVYGDQDGADDNATGVVGLLELLRMLKGQPLQYRLEIVAYTLEEPPFFRSQKMGSYIHAESVKERDLDLYGMICLEMIGYFDDTKQSQDYPIGFLSWFYGNKGDYITLVNKLSKGKFARKFSNQFKRQQQIRTKKFTGPKALQGIDFSDHLNYWRLGYSAVMITDTAFYRNKNYHETTDTLETLDIPRMAKVIDTTYETIISMK